MFSYKTLQQIIDEAEKRGISFGRAVLEDQAAARGVSERELFEEMRTPFEVMKEAAAESIESTERSFSGLSGGNARKLRDAQLAGKTVAGDLFSKTLARAVGIAERNACMGRIVAAPTAGACGILPAVLISLAEAKGLTDHDIILSLFASAGIGMVIASRASLSGAEGGCQAECGSAASMAAGAAVDLLGGTPAMVGHACAISMKSSLGLVCDPVAGLVEVPCVKRNALGAANALAAAELAMAGIESVIPADEVYDAMRRIGRSMPEELRETGRGGLADTPTAKSIGSKL
jgi:L-serine dehydratase